jgi:glycerol-3-phosphate dehydrogenase (NAD(P)+)
MGRVGVIGGGAFGTAMACVLRRRGHEVVLWAREPEVVDSVNAKRENAVFLRGVTLPENIVATGEMAAAVREAEFVLLVPPAQHMRAVTAALQPHLAAGTPVISCSKGIERGSVSPSCPVLPSPPRSPSTCRQASPLRAPIRCSGRGWNRRSAARASASTCPTTSSARR